MKPTHDDLCAAIIAIGAEYTTVAPDTIHRLAELRLAQWSNGAWELTADGSKLLKPLLEGERIEPLA
jgi:hypothetical protein